MFFYVFLCFSMLSMFFYVFYIFLCFSMFSMFSMFFYVCLNILKFYFIYTLHFGKKKFNYLSLFLQLKIITALAKNANIGEVLLFIKPTFKTFYLFRF